MTVQIEGQHEAAIAYQCLLQLAKCPPAAVEAMEANNQTPVRRPCNVVVDHTVLAVVGGLKLVRYLKVASLV